MVGLPNWKGRIVIDANNPIEAPLFKPADLGDRVSSAVFADLVPGARVVKAFNQLHAEVLAPARSPLASQPVIRNRRDVLEAVRITGRPPAGPLSS
jgi:predicted dinucleotide-binding enzyme